MIEIYVLVDNEALVMETQISLEFTNNEIYDLCYKAIVGEVEGKEFEILLIKHNKAFIRNIELYLESFHRYSTKQQKDINIKWLAEFSNMFGDIRKMKEPQKGEMLEFYFDELGNRFKEIKKEYDFIINKKYGIPTKTRLEEKIRRLGSSNK
jgi:hypothetical protein